LGDSAAVVAAASEYPPIDIAAHATDRRRATTSAPAAASHEPARSPRPTFLSELTESHGSRRDPRGGWVSGLVEAIAPTVIGLVKSGAKLPGGIPIEALFDWRKARPNAAPKASAPEPSQGEAAGPAEVAATVEALASEQAGAAGTMHLLAIWQGLSMEEQQRAQALVGRLTAEERAAWMAELAALTVPEAVARVRHIIRPHMPATTAAHSGTPTSEGTDDATMAAAASRPAPTSGVPGQSSASPLRVGMSLGSIFAATAPSRQRPAVTITGTQTGTAAPASRTPAATRPVTAAPAGTVPEAQGTAERTDPAAGRADPPAPPAAAADRTCVRSKRTSCRSGVPCPPTSGCRHRRSWSS